jgi:RNA polymerase sigma-70 factor (ECF subfamily)
MIDITLQSGSPLQSEAAASSPPCPDTGDDAGTVTDADLVSRFNSGNENAFAVIAARYRPKMFAVALSHVRNPSDAEEIAEDTLERAYRGLAGFRGDSSLSTWLHRIAFNLSYNRYKNNRRRRVDVTLSLDSAPPTSVGGTYRDLIACEAPGPVRDAEVRELLACVRVCMKKLGARHRQILHMRNSLSRSYTEISQSLGINIGSVKGRLCRARASLRAVLADSYPELGFETSAFGWLESSRPAGLLGVRHS